MHHNEPLRPSNTGWLVADVVPDTVAFSWSRMAPDPRLLALLSDPQWRPFLVYPSGSVATATDVVTRTGSEGGGRRPLYVILDGSWSESRRMFQRSPYLHGIPVIALEPEGPSRYRLRRSGKDANLCTAEVAALCLRLSGDADAAQALDAWLDLFVSRSLVCRGYRE